MLPQTDLQNVRFYATRKDCGLGHFIAHVYFVCTVKIRLAIIDIYLCLTMSMVTPHFKVNQFQQCVAALDSG